jgi:hypothetical protein
MGRSDESWDLMDLDPCKFGQEGSDATAVPSVQDLLSMPVLSWKDKDALSWDQKRQLIIGIGQHSRDHSWTRAEVKAVKAFSDAQLTGDHRGMRYSLWIVVSGAMNQPNTVLLHKEISHDVVAVICEVHREYVEAARRYPWVLTRRWR